MLAVAAVVLTRSLNAANATAAVAASRVESLEGELDTKVAQARKEAELEAKETAAELRSSLEADAAEQRARVEEAATAQKTRLEDETRQRNSRLEGDERRLKDRAEELDRRATRAERREEDLQRREAQISESRAAADAAREEADKLKSEASGVLETLSGLTPEEAQEQLLARVEGESRELLARRIKEVEEEVNERAEATAKNLISLAIQRYAGEYVCERTVSVVSLESDELKGRIIGREGRNIRALEAATGVDFIIDDTPNQVVISAFNPIRREVAKRALETLLEDGRVHPSRIDGVVRKAESEFHRVIRAAGDEAADEVGITGIHPEILKLIGALKYRTSYGQNQWQHAIEVAFICGMMADELGLDTKKAKRAGLLHDIGKVLDQTAEGSHALIGAEFAKKHGENREICNAIAAHHEEVPQETVYAVLAQAADAISGARPGARREMMQTYTQRLTDLERISNSFAGVDRSYAVQAGREIRVLVENAEVTDAEAVMLSQNIARKIESELQYPGQIKVTVIRETRVVQYAR
ncbi:MAG: ribonuclease Y [Proteobacteria bacterium]|nr:ribonuclease Y [Pseudomonadota bacterium]